MARVLLVMPHLPQRMGAAYLGQQYVAAALLADGHEVRCLDLAAVYFDGSDQAALDVVESFGPDLVGMTLFTYNARRGYELAAQLHGRTRLLVAGGPHATVCRREPVARGGFDVAVAGEAEVTLVEVARWLDGRTGARPLEAIGGLVFRDPDSGALVETPPRPALEDLDALAWPLESYPCYEAKWYLPSGGQVVPGGLMTSRGCPARCTFCANYVTGRSYRWRSTASVLGEMRLLAERHGVRHFPFWDDAFTARRSRIVELCEAILADPVLRGCTWTCITPGNMVRAPDLELMRRAGCVAINFGLESGDADVLRAIQKGIKPERVRESVRAARAAGMTTIVNFMFGFPGEGVDALERTLALMGELAADTDFFNNRGVLVPFPGTAIYDAHAAEYELQDWWLDPKRVVDEPNLFVLDPTQAQVHLEHDPTLDLDFFRYPDAVRDKIAECVRFKARHNAATLERLSRSSRQPATTLSLRRDATASVG